MNKISAKEEIDSIERRVTVQMVTFSVIIVVVILTFVSFIRIYSHKNERILRDMHDESELFKTVITARLNYSKYFIDIIGRRIQSNPKNFDYIHSILKEHYNYQELNTLFGWRKYSWVNADFFEVVTHKEGVLPKPKYSGFVKTMLEKKQRMHVNHVDWKDRIIFYAARSDYKGNSLKIIDNVYDNKGKKYVGSVVLSYDVDTLVQGLNIRKKNKSTNFVILNRELEVIATSTPIMSNIINEDRELESNLMKILKEIERKKGELKNVSHLDMIRGVNYFVSSVSNTPFIILINIDNNIIRKDIINSVARKFVEVCIFAVACLFIVISIYKRETFLRTKAEEATLAANNATKAKTNFLSFTAHEIRSPLGFILTGSEIMTKELMGKLPKKYIEYANGIHTNAKTILDFITDILDENQIIEGKFKILNTIAELSDIIDEAIRVNIARYSNRNVNILSNIKKGDLPQLICDKRRMLQVFSNLIGNSIKYSKDDTTITITGKIISNEMHIEIVDQGIGMNQIDVPIAISTYGTLHNYKYNLADSYGLGLPIVKMLLDAHDAKLSITSAIDEGTTVKIIFPKYKLIYSTGLG